MKRLLFTAVSLFLSVLCFSQSSGQYKVVDRIHLDGDKGWDYIAVDDSTNRLYVSHGDMVQVVDLNNGNKIIGTISGLNGVHGIAIAQEFNKGFITSGKDTSVVVFDLSTFGTLAKIKVSPGPDAIVYDKFSKKVFSFNGKSKSSTVIDAKTNAVVGTIDLPGKPEFCVADGLGKIYDNLEDKNMICVINTTTMKVENSWSIAPADGPSGLAIDTKTRRLFSVCDKTMVIVDADKGTILKTLPIGDRVDAAGFDYNLNRAYSSNGDGTLTVVQENAGDDFKVIDNVATEKGARTCCVNSKTHHIYLPDAKFNPAPAAAEGDKPKKPSIIPDSFIILDVAYSK